MGIIIRDVMSITYNCKLIKNKNSRSLVTRHVGGNQMCECALETHTSQAIISTFECSIVDVCKQLMIQPAA